VYRRTPHGWAYLGIQENGAELHERDDGRLFVNGNEVRYFEHPSVLSREVFPQKGGDRTAEEAKTRFHAHLLTGLAAQPLLLPGGYLRQYGFGHQRWNPAVEGNSDE